MYLFGGIITLRNTTRKMPKHTECGLPGFSIGLSRDMGGKHEKLIIADGMLDKWGENTEKDDNIDIWLGGGVRILDVLNFFQASQVAKTF